MSDVSEAAERLRRLMAGEKQRVVYGGDSDTHWRRMERQDTATLADAYLAKHTADDDVLLDAGYFKALGWRFHESCFGDKEWSDPYDLWTMAWYEETGDKKSLFTLDDLEMPHIKTRGSFRRLRAALGIELKEQANAQ